MIELFDDFAFLEFVLCKLDKEIANEEKLNETRNPFERELSYYFCKELGTMYKWRDKIKERIVNIQSLGGE